MDKFILNLCFQVENPFELPNQNKNEKEYKDEFDEIPMPDSKKDKFRNFLTLLIENHAKSLAVLLD